jgi:hypothetical protein
MTWLLGILWDKKTSTSTLAHSVLQNQAASRLHTCLQWTETFSNRDPVPLPLLLRLFDLLLLVFSNTLVLSSLETNNGLDEVMV